MFNFFFIFSVLIRWFPLFYPPGCLCILLYHLIYYRFTIFFILVIKFSALSGSFLYFLIPNILTAFLPFFLTQSSLWLLLWTLYQVNDICFIKYFFEALSCSLVWNEFLCLFVWSSVFYSMNYAAAKSLQSCPTLCNPVDSSPPASSVPGILQAWILEWVAISFSTMNYVKLFYLLAFLKG